MQILYCDCFSGISGDMFLAGLLDAGMPLEYLQTRLASLHLADQFQISAKKISKGAVQANQIQIQFDENYASPHRHLADIQHLIESSSLSAAVQQTSLAIFQKLGEAEAKVHGVPLAEVHFHEVGALDSIIDIIGAAVGLDFFGTERLYASPLPLGSGQVHTQHGLLPIPAPATLELLRIAQAQVVASPSTKELVTPTGAAILAALATFEQPAMAITRVGIGAGQKDFSWPNILRLIFGESDRPDPQSMVLIETNIDDMNPQIFGHIINHLFSNGALDVYYTPIFMKKNRPATMLSILARRSHEPALVQILFAETTTFGMRVQPVYRYEAERLMQTVHTEYGDIPVKLKIVSGQTIQASPEYEVCASLAEALNIPLIQVYQAALFAGRAWIQANDPPVNPSPQVDPEASRSHHHHDHPHQIDS